MSSPVLALTQGDPAGIGPEILLKLVQEDDSPASWRPILVAERAALEALRTVLPAFPWDRLDYRSAAPGRDALAAAGDAILVLDPVAAARQVSPGHSGPADAAGAMAALDAGVELVRSGIADALVTAPVSKVSIARQHLPGFVGHTEYLAAGCGLETYGRDYLMAFLAPDLQVALLSTHLPLSRALEHVRRDTVLEALKCLGRNVRGKIAVAGLNPHAGEDGLLGTEDAEHLVPAVAEARSRGLDVYGPVSADSLFAMARRGTYDWVLALYHDQGLIAVKTACFGRATNWTLGLPYLRTSVDHGTAFDLAGRGIADPRPLEAVVHTTLRMLSGELPRH
ncbi:MAG: 4-hydroxythreonine-4-phosphate dehydrogenase PdxA [Acidobacteria bacterium]|nr:4-hydroxythreonine-4-phosphate dehydrogenase PdxA [Acidobacteriota bacterium]